MSGKDSVKAWLVDRTITEKPTLINLTYATTDGRRYRLLERAITGQESMITRAAIEATADELDEVDDEEMRQDFAAEAQRMASRHTPMDSI